MANKKRWDDFTPAQKKLIIAAATVELVFTSIAVRDLARRPRRQVRGPKLLWLAAFSVQPVGPPLYLMVGRRTSA